jgi:hypothetical protein
MEELRKHARESFSEVFGVAADHPMAINAETSAFNYVTRRARGKGMRRAVIHGTKEAALFKEMYKNKILSILFNLKNPKNPRLLQAVLSKNIECRHVGFLTREQLFPELWEPIKEKLSKNDPSLLVEDEGGEGEDGGGGGDGGDGGVVRCGKCKNKGRVHVSIVQTRSADEGSTLFCYCKKCGGRWKIYT